LSQVALIKRRAAWITRSGAQFFFDPQQLIVFRDSI
jgi:hypothetical protein